MSKSILEQYIDYSNKKEESYQTLINTILTHVREADRVGLQYIDSIILMNEIREMLDKNSKINKEFQNQLKEM